MNKAKLGFLLTISVFAIGAVSVGALTYNNHQYVEKVNGTDCNFFIRPTLKPTLDEHGNGTSILRTLKLAYTNAEASSKGHVILNDGGTMGTNGAKYDTATGVGSVVNGLYDVKVVFNADPGAKLVLYTAYLDSTTFDGTRVELTSNTSVNLMHEEYHDELLPRYFQLKAEGGKIDIQAVSLNCTTKARDVNLSSVTKVWNGTYTYTNYDYGIENETSQQTVTLTYDNEHDIYVLDYPEYNPETSEVERINLYAAADMNPELLFVKNLNDAYAAGLDVYKSTSFDASRITIDVEDWAVTSSFEGTPFVEATSINIEPSSGTEANKVGDTLTLKAKVSPYGYTSKVNWTIEGDGFTLSKTSGTNNETAVVKSIKDGGSAVVKAEVDGKVAQITVTTKDSSTTPTFPNELVGDWVFGDVEELGYALQASFTETEMVATDDIFYFGETYSLITIANNSYLEMNYDDGYGNYFNFTYDGTDFVLIDEVNGMYAEIIGVKL